MNKENIFRHVEQATVSLLNKGAQGVLINDHMIITAAHCINFSADGSMVLGDYFIEDIQVGERKLRVAPLAVEPVNDLAILGALDYQEFPEEAKEFEDFYDITKPASICTSDFELFKEINIHILTHKNKWVTGTARQCAKDAHSLFVTADEEIEGGTSGGPIVNDSGELIGIVSNFTMGSEAHNKINGLAPRPHLCLPVWVCRRIFGDKITV